MPQTRQIRTTLTTHVVGPVSWDESPGIDVELDHVPVINLLASPIVRPVMPEYGITMHVGIQDIPQIAHRRQLEAFAHAAETLYEVQAVVQIGMTAPQGALRVEHIPSLQLLNLPRASPDTNDYLKALIREELDAVFGADATNMPLVDAVARHPRLLDTLANHPQLAHVAVIVWEAALPFDSNPNSSDTEEPLIRSAKLGTLYTDDPARIELRTLNSEWVRARLPSWVGNFPIGQVRKTKLAVGMR